MMLKDVMTASVRTIDSDESIRQAALLMRELDVGMLPIRQEERLVGTVTDRDITIRCTAEACNAESTPVSEIMTRELVFGYEDEDTETAVDTMEKHQVRRLLVMDRDDNCVGILSIGDLALRAGNPQMSEELLEEVSRATA